MVPLDEMRRLAGKSDHSGLSWTAEGPLLAGAPLLRTTVTGLAPRPVSEITALVAGAYGHHVDSAEILPRLHVVANALNKGDVGRAMVAALRLKLPPISWDGAVRIARVEQQLAKYDHAEPRDMRGRWTTGAPTNSTNILPAKRPVLPRRPAPPKHPISPKHPMSAKRPVRSVSPRNSSPPGPGEVALPDFESENLKPILVSDRESANDNLRDIPAALFSMLMTRECIGNAREPNYQYKVEGCLDARDKCNVLIEAGEKDPKFQGYCQWPDGSAAIIMGDILIPVSVGHLH